ncbi:hypothetical protein Tsp_04098 [Trichinella spiralis]|uniref:hypothetical protein n=1 Tax=Trichinella spiralis TaxID=6334 RepID=UPI0001EFB549|nr:hypothetical protein Tsp_04098 [Trichinella spiralis]
MTQLTFFERKLKSKFPLYPSPRKTPVPVITVICTCISQSVDCASCTTGWTEAVLRTRGKVVEKTGKQERKEFKTSHRAENVTNDDCLTDCLSEGR